MGFGQSGELHYRLSLAIAFAITVAVIASGGVIAWRNSQAQDETAAFVIRTHRTLATLNQVETTMIDAETGQRGFLLTGEEEFLEPYLAATGTGSVPVIHRPPVGPLLDALHRLPAESQLERELLRRIDTLVRAKLEELEQTVILRREGRLEQALRIVREGRGKRTMDTLRTTLSAMRVEQRHRLELSEARRAQAARNAYVSSVAACVVSLFAIAFLVLAGRRAERGLLRQEERFHMLADRISQHAWTLSANGSFLWFNRRWEEYTGLSGSDLDGQWRAATDHPVHRDRVRQGLRHAVDSGEAWEDIFPLRAHDGSWQWFLVRAVPISGPDGKVACWFGTDTDIDERLRLEQELKDANRRKDEFIATLAHELRNPLAPVQAGLDLMRISPAFPAPLVRMREIMGRQLAHLVRLLDDLLDVTRISTGKLELRREPVALRGIIESAAEASRLQIESAGHTLDVSLPAEPLPVDADPVRLAQVLGNLLNNGAKYTPSGGLVRIVARREGSEAAVSVIDNGIGIDAAMLPHVFDLFSQAAGGRERRQGGIGIGLSISRRLVEMHGGTLVAESEGLGRGSRFTVRLPLAHGGTDGGAAAATAVPVPAPAIEQEAERTAEGSRRILVLDDNVDAAQMLGALLGAAGHRVELAHTGREAIELARSFVPDLAFLDIGLPDISGYEVAHALRRQAPLRHACLVALTGWGAAADRQRSKDAGFDLHLTKPVSLEALAAALPGLALPSDQRTAEN
jgi:PAS domain S-box-containing protein